MYTRLAFWDSWSGKGCGAFFIIFFVSCVQLTVNGAHGPSGANAAKVVVTDSKQEPEGATNLHLLTGEKIALVQRWSEDRVLTSNAQVRYLVCII